MSTTESVAEPIEPAAPAVPQKARRAPLGVFGFALFSLLLFWPTGIPAVLNAIRSREAWVDGSDEGYTAARTRSLVWSWVSIGIVVAFMLLYVLAVLALFAAAGSGEMTTRHLN